MALTYGFDLGATSRAYTSAQFSDLFSACFGSAATRGLRLTLGSGLTVDVSSGFGCAAGRWLESDAPLTFHLAPPYNASDRSDALALVVDYAARRVTLELLSDVDPLAPVRDGERFETFLYLIRVRRGATMLYEADVADCRALIEPLSALSDGALAAYRFAVGGADEAIAQIVARSAETVAAAEEEAERLRALVAEQTGTQIGDLREAVERPAADWLLCDGAPVPAAYAALIARIGETLPRVESADGRLNVWIYGGTAA